jgi:hypothetical protein
MHARQVTPRYLTLHSVIGTTAVAVADPAKAMTLDMQSVLPCEVWPGGFNCGKAQLSWMQLLRMGLSK